MQDKLVGRPHLLRDLNYRAVMESIAVDGPLSRVEVASRLDLSQPSISRVADALIQADLLVEGERIASKAGRKQILLDVNREAAVVTGISIRSQYVRILLTDLKGDIITRRRVKRDRQSADSLVQQIRSLLQDICDSVDAPLAAICVGISGAWDVSSCVVYSAPNLPYLEDVDLLTLLETELTGTVSVSNIAVDNDVNYAALGEYIYGAAQEVESFFYLNLGSGIGGGIVVHGKLHTGFQGFAGEVGFLPIYGADGYHSLESLISRSAIDTYARESQIAETMEGLFKEAYAQNQAALALVDKISRYISLALCSIVTTMNPELIVIGGSIGRYSDLLIPQIEIYLSSYLPIMPKLVGTELDGDASLRGAVARSLEMGT